MIVTGSVHVWVMPRASTSAQSRSKDIGILQLTWTESVVEDSLPYKYLELCLNHYSVYGMDSCLKQEWFSLSLLCLGCGTIFEDALAINADRGIILTIYLIILLTSYEKKV